MKLLEGKTVLVTGASTGIGRAAAIGAAKAGADVAINYHSRDDDAQACVAAIEAEGQRGLAVKGDVADHATATEFVARAVEAFGKVDVMVSNAGICPFHSFLDMPPETLERTMRVNLHGGYYMCQAAGRQMVAQGHGGAIVAVSSISALVGGEYQTHYTPTKAGLHSLMQSAAIALGKHNIRCNSVLPGTILTEINKEDLADTAKRERMAARIPLGRLGEAEDLAGPIVFLASDMAAYVTGAALLVDGGAFVNLQ
ncbi:MAG: SDR family NAD(P)-dependent oxidoreductase [Pseudomonadota bacterium]